jgi:membrane-associated phospholipid phosphatase
MNEMLFRYLNSFAGSAWDDQAAVFLAVYLPVLLVAAAAIFLFLHIEARPRENAWISFGRKIGEISFVFIVSAAAWGVSVFLKNIIHAPRPFAVLSGVHKIFSPDDPYSFPSGHATFFSALATALYFYHRRIGIIFGLGALLIGVSRIVAGIHYPADILTGWCIGIIIAGLVAYLRKKV